MAVRFGTSHHDDMVGTDGDDVLSGLGGDDRFIASAGADTFIGGDGNDTVDYLQTARASSSYLGFDGVVVNLETGEGG